MTLKGQTYDDAMEMLRGLELAENAQQRVAIELYNAMWAEHMQFYIIDQITYTGRALRHLSNQCLMQSSGDMSHRLRWELLGPRYKSEAGFMRQKGAVEKGGKVRATDV